MCGFTGFDYEVHTIKEIENVVGIFLYVNLCVIFISFDSSLHTIYGIAES